MLELEQNRRSVLCYGDSNTWGANPIDISRFAYADRWPGKLATLLGSDWQVIEAGLSNRTTCFEDPDIPHRRGDLLFPMIFDSHAPLTNVVVMLGTNDPKTRVGGTVSDAVQGVARIANFSRDHGAEVLVVAPAVMQRPIKYPEFFVPYSIDFCEQFTEQLRNMAVGQGFNFFDANEVVTVSSADGVHLDRPAHSKLAFEIATKLNPRSILD